MVIFPLAGWNLVLSFTNGRFLVIIHCGEKLGRKEKFKNYTDDDKF